MVDVDDVLHRLIDWANEHPQIRTMLLTSTRARPDAKLDPFSDYDIIIAVHDVRPFFDDRSWLRNFGTVLAVYRDPLRERCGFEQFGYVTQYEHDRLKIDFTVLSAALLGNMADDCPLRNELDMGYQVLVDKDNITHTLPAPTCRAFIPRPPDEATYCERIEIFFHEATYVAKNIWRDELLPAKYSFDEVMKQHLLRQMLEWLMEIEHNWSLPTGVLGKGLKRYTRPDLWKQLESTYVGVGAQENWDALFRLIDLYRIVAVEVGEHLNYAYPYELDQRNCRYLREVQSMPRQVSG